MGVCISLSAPFPAMDALSISLIFIYPLFRPLFMRDLLPIFNLTFLFFKVNFLVNESVSHIIDTNMYYNKVLNLNSCPQELTI